MIPNKKPMPRPAVVIEKQLNDLMKVKKLADEYGVHGFTDRIRMKNLAEEEARLQEELYATRLLDSGNDLEVSFDGDAVKDHTIEANFLGTVLIGVQEVTDKVTFAAGAQVSVSGTIPEEERFESKMMVVGWHASSFTVQFRLPPIKDVGDFLASERRDIALSALHELFDDATPEEKLTHLITKSAVKTAYKKLLENIANQNTTVRLRTKVNPYGAKLSAEKAEERSQWMETPEKKDKEEIITVTGILVGGNIDTHRFTIKTKGSPPYSGTVSKDAQEQMRIKLGSWVKALIKEITKYKTRASPEPSVSYTLESIVAIPEAKNVELFE